MLKELKISNYAIIENLSVEFHPGFNALTGETGAGKSIIIEALNLVLGGRGDPDSIRSAEKSATVEALFEVKDPKTLQMIRDLGIEVDQGQVIIRRVLSKSSKTRSYLNDNNITLAALSRLGNRLVDIHGQHHHQALLHNENHVELLDLFGKLTDDKNRFKCQFGEYHSKVQNLKKLELSENERLQRQDLLNFQIQEIDQINPVIGEDEELTAERNRLRHGEKLTQSLKRLQEILSDSDGSIVDRLGIANNELESLIEIDPSLEKQAERGRTSYFEIQELAEELRDYSRSLEFSPTRLEEIEDRLAELNGLKRKYGNDIAAILEHREKIGAELDTISGGQEKIDALKTELEELGSILSSLAADLANKREQAAKRMQKVVEKELRDLSMNQARFAVNFQYPPDPDSFAVYKNKKVKVSLNGIGASEFFFSSNPGEELRPLAKIASGGEISRVMLALKSILNDQEATPTMIFDEVDSGISGKVAEQVGVKLKKIAKEKQVFSITHLPQIAGMASAHYLVHKAVKGKRTQTMILELDYEHRVEEIARMSGGEKISATTLRHAKEMIK